MVFQRFWRVCDNHVTYFFCPRPFAGRVRGTCKYQCRQWFSIDLRPRHGRVLPATRAREWRPAGIACFPKGFQGFAITVSAVFSAHAHSRAGCAGHENTNVSQWFPLILGRAMAVSPSGHSGARMAYCWKCLFYHGLSRFCDNHVSFFAHARNLEFTKGFQ